MSDSEFFREIEEEVRREKLNEFWDKYGVYIVAGAVALVAAVGGSQMWDWWRTTQSQEAGAQFVAAERLVADGKDKEARGVFEQLVSDGPQGYPMVARLRLAGIDAKNGKIDEALKAYDAIAEDSGSDSLLANYARIKAASLRVDEADFQEVKERVGDLTGTSSAWRHSARELLGLSAYKEKNFDTANNYFTEILGDQDAPQNLRQRAEMMLTLIAGNMKPNAEVPSKTPTAAN